MRGSLEINEDTKVPLKAAIASFFVLMAAVAWGLRLEWNVGTKVAKEAYVEDMNELKSDVKAIKKHLKIKD